MVKTTRFDAADYLDTPVARAEYLSAALETGDADFVRDAYAVVARAEGMTKLAKRVARKRESLSRSLSAKGNPEFATVLQLSAALGLKLQAVPAGAARAPKVKTRKRKSGEARAGISVGFSKGIKR